MNYLWAFLIGGAICAVGQLFIDLTKLTPARILTGYVVAGCMRRWQSLPVRGRACPCWALGICWQRGCALPWRKRVPSAS
jgi:hypothetical protein